MLDEMMVLLVTFALVTVELSTLLEFTVELAEMFDLKMVEFSMWDEVTLLPRIDEPRCALDALSVESLTKDAKIVPFVMSCTLLMLPLRITVPRLMPVVVLMLESSMTIPVVPKLARSCRLLQYTVLGRLKAPGRLTLNTCCGPLF